MRMRVSRCVMRDQTLIRDERTCPYLASRSRISLRDPGAFYVVALAQLGGEPLREFLVMRLTTRFAPDSTSEASLPEISTCASMGIADEPGACPARP